MHKGKYTSVKVAEKQNFLFLVYEAMGPTRTLRRLQEVCGKVGVKLGLKSIENYSRKYHWQRRLLERSAERGREVDLDAKKVVEVMNESHAALFQDITTLARAGVSFYQAAVEESLKVGKPGLQMEIADLVRLAESGQRGERLARGQATSRVEILAEVLQPLVKDIFAVFLAVNVITNDPPEITRKRQAEFVKRGDQLLQSYWGQKELTGPGGKED